MYQCCSNWLNLRSSSICVYNTSPRPKLSVERSGIVIMIKFKVFSGVLYLESTACSSSRCSTQAKPHSTCMFMLSRFALCEAKSCRLEEAMPFCTLLWLYLLSSSLSLEENCDCTLPLKWVIDHAKPKPQIVWCRWWRSSRGPSSLSALGE